MTIKEIVAKLDECRAALEDDHIPELEGVIETDNDVENEAIETKLADLGEALRHIERAIFSLEDYQ